MRTLWNNKTVRFVRTVISALLLASMLLQLLPGQGLKSAFGEELESDATQVLESDFAATQVPIAPYVISSPEEPTDSKEDGSRTEDVASGEHTQIKTPQEETDSLDESQGLEDAIVEEDFSPEDLELECKSAAEAEAELEASQHVRIVFVPNGATNGAMDDFDYVRDGEEHALPKGDFVRDGYVFVGWATTPDGEDWEDDPNTQDTDESMKGYFVPDEQRMALLVYALYTYHDDGTFDTTMCDLKEALHIDEDGGDVLTLYAQWSPATPTRGDERVDDFMTGNVGVDEAETSNRPVSIEDTVVNDIQSGDGIAIPAETPLHDMADYSAGYQKSRMRNNALDVSTVSAFGAAFDASAQASNGVTVHVTAPAGALPTGVQLNVREVSRDAFIHAIAYTGVELSDARAVDISFEYCGQEIEPAEGREVTVTLDCGDMPDDAPITFFHVSDDGQVEKIVEATSAWTTFTAKEFSAFGAGSVIDSNTTRIRITFEGAVTEQMSDITTTVIEGDVLDERKAPDSGDPNKVFDCWAIGETSLKEYFGVPLTAEQIQTLKELGTEDAEKPNLFAVTAKPKYRKGKTIYVHNRPYDWENGTDVTTDTMLTDENYCFPVSEIRHMTPEHYTLDKDFPWESRDDEGGIIDQFSPSGIFSAEDNEYELYPRYVEYRLLSYDVGKANNRLSQRIITERTSNEEFKLSKANGDLPTDDDLGANLFYAGYRLEGWFFDKACTQAVPDGYSFSEDLTIYANWKERDDIPYTVWYMIEPAQGAPDGCPGNDDTVVNYSVDQYLFYKKSSLDPSDSTYHKGTTGAEITFSTAQVNKELEVVSTLFYYYDNGAKSKTENEKVYIKPDGTSVKKIYFNRVYFRIIFNNRFNNKIKYIKYGEPAADYDPDGVLALDWKYENSKHTYYETQTYSPTHYCHLWWTTVNEDTAAKGTGTAARKAAWSEQPFRPSWQPASSAERGTLYTLVLKTTTFYKRAQYVHREADPGVTTADTDTILGKKYYFNKYTVYFYNGAQYSPQGAASDAKAAYFLHKVLYRDNRTTHTNAAPIVIPIGKSEVVIGNVGGDTNFKDVELWFIRNVFEINFHHTLGNNVPSLQVRYLDTIHSFPSPYDVDSVVADAENVNKKYQFVGWYTTEEAANNYSNSYYQRYKYTGFEADSNETVDSGFVAAGGLDLYGAWAIKKYTISFDPDSENNGEFIPDQVCESGEYAEEPATPTKVVDGENLTFAGWYLNGNTNQRWNFDTPVTDNIHLVAKWTTNGRHSVTYLNEDGTSSTVSDTHTYAYGARAYTQLRDSSVPYSLGDRTFVGWSTKQYDDASNAIVAGTGFVVEGDTTLYAVYAKSEKDPAPKYVLTLHANYPSRYSGNVGVDQQYAVDKYDIVNLPDSISSWSAPGYHIGSWNTQADGNGLRYETKQDIIVSGDTDLYAQWETDEDYLVFDKNASDATGMMDALYGRTFSNVVIPNRCGFVRIGYTFDGWRDARGNEYGKGGTLYELKPGVDVLYAQWKKNVDVGEERHIIYLKNAEDASGTTDNTDGYEGQKVSIARNGYVRSGYSFDYWSDEPGGTTAGGVRYDPFDDYDFGDDLTLYAQWKGDLDRLRYDKNEDNCPIVGAIVVGSMTDAMGFVGQQIMVRQCAYTAQGLRFVEWNTDPTGAGRAYDPNDSSSNTYTLTSGEDVLYAIWEVDPDCTASLNYHANDSQATGTMDSTWHKLGTYADVKECEFGYPPGKWFAGWNTESDYTGDWYSPGDSFLIAANVNDLYAKWSYLPDELLYDKNADDAAGSIDPTYGWTGLPVTVHACNPNTDFFRPGYKFLYWNTRPDGLGVSYYPNDPTQNTYVLTTNLDVLYAIWGPNVGREEDVLTYDGNGATGGYTAPTYGYHGDAVLVRTNGFYRDGYVFVGWNKLADGSDTDGWYYPWDPERNTYRYLLSTVTDVLYAQWVPINEADVDYLRYEKNADGAEGSMTPTVGLLNATVGVKKSDFEHGDGFKYDGYKLICWNTKPDGSGDAYPADGYGTYTLVDGVDDVLYAQWQQNEIAITYDKNAADATGTMSPQYVVEGGSALARTNAFVRPGYTFLRWMTEPNGGTKYVEGARVPIAGGLTASLTLYAEWTPSNDQLNYDANGGTGDAMSPTLGQTFDTVPISACTYTPPAGQGFLHWNTKPDDSGTSYDWTKDGYQLTPGEDILYAIWKDGLLLSFDKNADDATGGPMSPIAVPAGGGVYVPDCIYTREKYIFVQWNTEPDGSGTPFDPDAQIILTTNVTLYAQWKRIGWGHEVPPFPTTGGVGDNPVLAWAATGVVVGSGVVATRRRRKGKK